MTDSKYHQLADSALKRIESALDDTDIDCETGGGGLLQLTFPNRTQIIINKQPPRHELWVAAKSGGFHYAWKDGEWRDGRNGGEFFADVTRLATEQFGAPVRI